MGSPEIREIHRKTDLAADLRTGDVSASEQAETETEAIAKRVLAAGHGLKLAFDQIVVFSITAVELASECEPAVEIVKHREAAGVNLAAGVLKSDDAGTGVAGEQYPQVCSDSGFFC